MGEVRKNRKDAILLIDQAHADLFNRYQNYYSRGNISLEAPGGPSFVLVLTQISKPGSFSVSANNQVETLPLTNVAGMIPGKSRPDEYVIFSGHYDHIGALPPVKGDSIANGADDDASGTTAVIALARYFKALNNNERTILFVAFTAEEIGGYGSQHFSKQLAPEKVVAMFNIEMIGKESKFGSNTAFITGYEKTDFGKILQKNLEGTEFTFHPDPYTEQNLFYRSDNATLARQGVPAHTISTDQIDVDKYYHTVDDEYETLNISNVVNTIRAIALSARSIISGQDTPGRVDTSDLK
jgi:Zn-dependent M28 family amino/carboxypeptidase